MKRPVLIGLLLLLTLAACHTPTREARRMLARAERLADTLPDSTLRLIDSVMRMEAYLSERERMDMALLQGKVLFRDASLDDDFSEMLERTATSPELEHAADYYVKKKHFDKATHAALYSGYVQQYYNDKEAAMLSFKDAEHFGELVWDSLTMARAEYWIGKMLYDDYSETEALSMLKASDRNFGTLLGERAFVQNMEAVAYMLLKQYDSAELCLKKSLAFAEQSRPTKARRKALNNYSVFYQRQGDYAQAISCLKQMSDEPDLTNTEKAMLYLNFGKTFAAFGETDSAAVYYQRLEGFLSDVSMKDETKVSAYGALARFAESLGKDSLALQYRDMHENLLFEVMHRHQERTVYRIQKQYDYESLQNEMNKKLIRRQHIITFFGIVTIIGLAALAISQIRLAKTRKLEAETKANLFHFMQQNKELTQKHKESEQAYEDLLKEKEVQEQVAAEYGEKLSLALKKEQAIMLRLHLFLENQGDDELLKKLEKSVFGKQAHMDAMMETVDRLYPQLCEIVKQEDLGLDEYEQMDIIMSYFNISRQDEALLLDKTVDMIDKIRNRSRKKIQAASKRIELPKTV